MARNPFPGERPKDWDFQGPEKSGGAGKIVLIGIGVIAGLAVLGSIMPDSPPEKASGGAPESPPLAVSAAELAKAYADNEVAARQRYGARKIKVTGIVAAIDLDLLDQPVVRLEGVNRFMPVSVNLEEEDTARAGELAKGDSIAAVCADIMEVAGSAHLLECRMAD